MSGDAWITLIVLTAVLVLLVTERVPPAAAVTLGMIAVLVAGVVTPEQALSGFANPAPITVAALYVLARAVEKTGALVFLVRAVLGKAERVRAAIGRLVIPVATMSAFLNNTPLVAMLIPQVTGWAEENKKSPSYFLMPLSFAALLGGCITVIGTSTNIVVSGLLVESGQEGLGFFELGLVGLPIAVAGSLLMVLLAPILLRGRRGVRGDAGEGGRRFVIDMTIDHNGPMVGQAVQDAGLRHLSSLFLAVIERGGEVIAPVTPDTILRGGDRLRFVGRVGDLVDLQAMRGLKSSENHHVVDLRADDARYFEVVIGTQSDLVNKTLKDVGFRGRYQAVVLAIHREGQNVDEKLGEVTIRPGDTLLVLADPGFRDRWRDRGDFLLISGGLGSPIVSRRKAWIVAAIGVAVITTAATGVLTMLEASLIGGVLLLWAGVLTPAEIRSAVDLDVIIVIASAFGLAAAMSTSGLAETIADGLVAVFEPYGERGIILGVVLATIVLTGLITNNAAALLMFPIAISTAVTAGISARGLAIAIAVSASVDFLTPIGYQTNMMVYGPGGYRFLDYARLGAPLTVVATILLVALVPVFWA
jgi:di/tricarboxylate transporter